MRHLTIVLSALMILTASTVRCEIEINDRFSLAGFGDLIAEFESESSDEKIFSIGQIELHVEGYITDDVHIELALALEDDETVGAEEFMVAFLLSGDEGHHIRPMASRPHGGLVVGKFFVPFGLDWKVKKSIDRALISAPGAVSYTVGEWNDLGVQGHYDNDRFSLVGYVVNGFDLGDDSEVVVDPLESTIGPDVPGDGFIESHWAIGGRGGVWLNEMVQVGTSFARLDGIDDDESQTLFGVDAEFEYFPFWMKGEYISHKIENGGEELTNSSWYVQMHHYFGDNYVVIRHSQIEPENQDGFYDVSAGVGIALKTNTWLRFEYRGLQEQPDFLLFQIAAGF
jgi:hypothetical protein